MIGPMSVGEFLDELLPLPEDASPPSTPMGTFDRIPTDPETESELYEHLVSGRLIFKNRWSDVCMAV